MTEPSGGGELGGARRALAGFAAAPGRDGVPIPVRWEEAVLTRLAGGLVNRSWRVDAPIAPVSAPAVAHPGGGSAPGAETGRVSCVLQRLHTVFAPEVNRDIVALGGRLRAAGVAVPYLASAAAPPHEPWVVGAGPGEDRGVWRLLSWLPGRTVTVVQGPAMARVAGAAVGRFHGALHGVAHRFAFSRPGAHDTDAHVARLSPTVAAHARHRLVGEVAQVAGEISRRWEGLRPPAPLPLRLGHGDLKLSNLRFAEGGVEVVGFVDLDTMAWLPLDVELGDALRSWCNPAGEDTDAPTFDESLFLAALEGYVAATRGVVAPGELAAVPGGVARVALELAARFAADALDERYFGWDPAVTPGAGGPGEHNLLRARGQLGLARQVLARLPRLEALVGELLAGSVARSPTG